MSLEGKSIIGQAPKKVEDTYILVNVKDETDLEPEVTTVYIYAK